MERSLRMRGVMALVGGLAGLSLHILFDAVTNGLLPDAVALWLSAFAVAFLTGVLAMAGPLGLGRAALGAGVVAAASAGLVLLSTLRLHQVWDAVEKGLILPAFFACFLLPLPFWIAANLGHWRDYPLLFTHAWRIVLRFLSALAFTGLVWGVLMLSDALLEVVGITLIGDVVETSLAPWVITGVALGLAVAVANELRDYMQPTLALLLLRVLLPVVLLVMVVFIVALPVRGTEGLFGSLSVATTLLSMAVAGATLVTAAIDRDEGGAVHMPAMVWCTRALAALLPVPAALAGWSAWLRVSDYGWTPERVFGALAAGLALAYGLAYLAAVLRRDWAARIRRANVWLAVLTIALAGLWQTPLLDADAISAASQSRRVEAGEGVAAASFVGFGIAGERALADLEARAATDDRIRTALQTNTPEGTTADVLAAELPVRPETAADVRDRMLAAADPATRRNWLEGCQRAGCVMVVAPFIPDDPRPQALLLFGEWGRMEGMILDGRTLEMRYPEFLGEGRPDIDIDAILAGPQITPAPLNQLQLGGRGVVILP